MKKNYGQPNSNIAQGEARNELSGSLGFRNSAAAEGHHIGKTWQQVAPKNAPGTILGKGQQKRPNIKAQTRSRAVLDLDRADREARRLWKIQIMDRRKMESYCGAQNLIHSLRWPNRYRI
jgi:hypothetical protein